MQASTSITTAVFLSLICLVCAEENALREREAAYLANNFEAEDGIAAGEAMNKRTPADFAGDQVPNFRQLQTHPQYGYYKRRPMGFVGMRGKKVPSGFFGMRGKKTQRVSGFFGMRGKKIPYEFRGKFVGVRGKKDDEYYSGTSNTVDLNELRHNIDLNQLMLLLTESEEDRNHVQSSE